MFCRSLDVLRCRSSVSWSWLLRAVSSSLSDCSSSFEVVSSSLVDWNSSLTDSASSLIAFCSSFEISRSRMALCKLLAGGVELPLELGDPRDVAALRCDRPVRPCSLRGLVEEADQQQFLAVALHRMDLDADRERMPPWLRLRRR